MLAARAPAFDTQWSGRYPVGSDAARVADFVRAQFCEYASLDSSKVRPSDQLGEDLGFPAVAYSDWEFDLAEEFEREFNVPLSVKALPPDLSTLGVWVEYLVTVLAPMQSAASESRQTSNLPSATNTDWPPTRTRVIRSSSLSIEM